MERKEGKNFTGNDRYIGYCADLTERISKMLNFTYEFRMVKDSKFGSKGFLFYLTLFFIKDLY